MSGVVTAQVKVETEQQTRDLRETTATLRTQVDDLAREFAESLNRISADRDAAVEAVRLAPTFEGITVLLERANDVQALRQDSLVFGADAELDAPRFSIFWGPPRQHGRSRSGPSAPTGELPSILIAYELPQASRAGGWTPAEVSWRRDRSPAEILLDLTEALRTAGHTEAAARINHRFFDSLAPAIEAAIAGRERRPGFWMRGRLHEWVADGWAVTDEGLESRDGHRVEAADFPSRDAMSTEAKSNEPRWKRPTTPPGVDTDLWDFAIERASQVHHQAATVFAMYNSSSGYTTTSSPLRR